MEMVAFWLTGSGRQPADPTNCGSAAEKLCLSPHCIAAGQTPTLTQLPVEIDGSEGDLRAFPYFPSRLLARAQAVISDCLRITEKDMIMTSFGKIKNYDHS